MEKSIDIENKLWYYAVIISDMEKVLLVSGNNAQAFYSFFLDGAFENIFSLTNWVLELSYCLNHNDFKFKTHRLALRFNIIWEKLGKIISDSSSYVFGINTLISLK